MVLIPVFKSKLIMTVYFYKNILYSALSDISHCI